jgi:hypothetical protein
VSPPGYYLKNNPHLVLGLGGTQAVIKNIFNLFIMVLIEKLRELEDASGKTFVVLDLVSAEPTVKVSQATGKPYLTLLRASISCTFSKEVAATLVGQKLPGKIQKVEVDPYEYISPSTGVVMILNHTNRFIAEPTAEEAVFS